MQIRQEVTHNQHKSVITVNTGRITCKHQFSQITKHNLKMSPPKSTPKDPRLRNFSLPHGKTIVSRFISWEEARLHIKRHARESIRRNRVWRENAAAVPLCVYFRNDPDPSALYISSVLVPKTLRCAYTILEHSASPSLSPGNALIKSIFYSSAAALRCAGLLHGQSYGGHALVRGSLAPLMSVPLYTLVCGSVYACMRHCRLAFFFFL